VDGALAGAVPHVRDAAGGQVATCAALLVMEFDSNLRSGLPWTFRPVEKSVRFHPGELVQVEFEVRNNSDRR
jgi:cytochrome c oxidase assembly protein Cox11